LTTISSRAEGSWVLLDCPEGDESDEPVAPEGEPAKARGNLPQADAKRPPKQEKVIEMLGLASRRGKRLATAMH
jgi:hypothetical protein